MRDMRAARLTSVAVIGLVAVIAAIASGNGALRLRANAGGDRAEDASSQPLPWPQANIEMDRELLRVADPASQTFYPPALVSSWLPARSAQRFTLGLHALLAAWGMYRLLRDSRHARWAALFGAVAFGLSCSLGGGCVGLEMLAAAWIPCILWRLRRLVQAGSVMRLLWATMACSLPAFAGRIDIAAFTALAALVWLVVDTKRLATPLLHWGMVCVCAAAVFAVQGLPWLEVRSLIEDEEVRGALGAFAWYPGVLTVLLAVVALARKPWYDARQRGWLVLGAAGLVGWLIPVVGDRAVVFVRLALVALAAGVLHELATRLSPRQAQLRAALVRWTQRPVRGVVLIAFCTLGTASSLSLPGTEFFDIAAWMATLGQPLLLVFVVAAAGSWLWLHWAARRGDQHFWPALAVLLVAADLAFGAGSVVSDCRVSWPRPATVVSLPTADINARGPAYFEDAAQPGAVRYVRDAAATARLWVDTWPAESKPDGDDKYELTRVVVAQRALPGWQAFWHEHRVPIEKTEWSWMVVSAPIGLPVEIHWEYQTPGLRAGAVISVATLLVLIGGIVVERRRSIGTTHGT